MCPLNVNQTAPTAISVVARLLYPPANLLAVVDNYNDTKPINKFAVCIKPLHYDYNRVGLHRSKIFYYCVDTAIRKALKPICFVGFADFGIHGTKSHNGSVALYILQSYNRAAS